MNKIVTDKAPSAIGPYSQGTIYGDLIFTSGQIPISPETGAVVEGGMVEQAEQVMKNLSAVLDAGGSSLDRVLKTCCFISDMADFAVFNEVYSKYITGAPARSCVAVKTLPKNVMCEVEAIAVK